MADTSFIAAIRLTFSIILLVAGAYLLLCAIRRKGIVYSNPPLHNSDKYEVYVRFVRITCFVLPAVFTATFVMCFLSFSAVNTLRNYALENNVSAYEAYSGHTRLLYNAATGTLIGSVAAVIIMLILIALFTGLWSGEKKEKLSGDHPAFKKHK